MLKHDGDAEIAGEKVTYEVLKQRPGFIEKLDPREIRLDRIIKPYWFDQLAPCGLSVCRTGHKKGYLVLAEGGQETNLGNICGKKHFKVEWQLLKKSHIARINEARYRTNLTSLKRTLNSLRTEIDSVLDGEFGAKNRLKKMTFQIERGFEIKTINGLKLRAQRGSHIIAQAVMASEHEKGIAEMFNDPSNRQANQRSAPKLKYKEEILYIIAGLSAVQSYTKLKSIVSLHLGDRLNHFQHIEIDALSAKDLKHWNEWGRKIKQRIQEAKEITEECARFLEPSNIQAIRQYKHLL